MGTQFDVSARGDRSGPRVPVFEVLAAALDAVEPEAAVRSHLRRDAGSLWVGDAEFSVPTGRVVLLAVGKAAGGMARGAMAALAGVAVVGVVVAPEPVAVAGLESLVGEHPVPGPGSRRAGNRLLELAAAAGPDDLVVVLLSGGGSALAEAPLPGIDGSDLAALTIALLRSGLPITEVNTVRRHLSRIKGGGLAQAAFPAPVATLVVSDVVGNPLEAIAGGPTVPDPTSPSDALRVIAAGGLVVPEAVRTVLERPAAPARAVTGAVTVIADGPGAARAGAAAARERSIAATVAPRPLLGEARVAGVGLAAAARRLRVGEMVFHAGETTVRVTGAGVGGRNHEVALAAGIALEGEPGTLVAALATDGVDGPSGAAGGIGDAATLRRGQSHGLDGRKSLAENDSATFLRTTGDQLRCGPTGTNVGDLAVVYRYGQSP